MDITLTTVEENDQLCHVKISGRLDHVGEKAVREQMLALAGQGKPLLIDLSGLRYMGSVGLGLLFECGKILSGQELKMVIFKPQVIVAKALECSGVAALVSAEHNYDKAMALLLGSKEN